MPSAHKHYACGIQSTAHADADAAECCARRVLYAGTPALFLTTYFFGKAFGLMSTFAARMCIALFSSKTDLASWQGLFGSAQGIASMASTIIIAIAYENDVRSRLDPRGTVALAITVSLSLVALMLYSGLSRLAPPKPKALEREMSLVDDHADEAAVAARDKRLAALPDAEWRQLSLAVKWGYNTRRAAEGQPLRHDSWGTFDDDVATGAYSGARGEECAERDLVFLRDALLSELESSLSLRGAFESANMEEGLSAGAEGVEAGTAGVGQSVARRRNALQETTKTAISRSVQQYGSVRSRDAERQQMGQWVVDYLESEGYSHAAAHPEIYKALIIAAFPPVAASGARGEVRSDLAQISSVEFEIDDSGGGAPSSHLHVRHVDVGLASIEAFEQHQVERIHVLKAHIQKLRRRRWTRWLVEGGPQGGYLGGLGLQLR